MWSWLGDRFCQAATMVAVNMAFGIVDVLTKRVVDEGVCLVVVITLRQVIATISISPIAYFMDRGSKTKMTLEICAYLFFSALLVSLSQTLFFFGMQNTSATFACAFLNLTPVLTFLISIVLRKENLNVRSTAGLAMILGAAVNVGGAVLQTFYKGVVLHLTHQPNLLHMLPPSPSPTGAVAAADGWSGRTIFGTAAVLGGSFLWCCWFHLQSKVNSKYPVLCSSMVIIFFLSFIQEAILTFATGNGVSLLAVWKKLEILTILFGGVVTSIGFLATSWCIRKRGPVFPAVFTPLIQIVGAIIEVLTLHQPLHLGSVLGSVLMIFGLSVFIWGKDRAETRREGEQLPEDLQQIDLTNNGQVQCTVKCNNCTYISETHGPDDQVLAPPCTI